ncbi:MAG: hypothetical protein ACKVWR_12620 [Acidimicrobiales bacterium]
MTPASMPPEAPTVLSAADRLLAAYGEFDVEVGLFAESDEVIVLAHPDDPAEGDGVDLVVSVRPSGGHPRALEGAALTLRGPAVAVARLNGRGQAWFRNLPGGRWRLGVLRPARRRPPLSGAPASGERLALRALAPAALGGRSLTIHRWQAAEVDLAVELAETEEGRLVLSVSAGGDVPEDLLVRLAWRVAPERGAGPERELTLVTPLAAGPDGRRGARYDVGGVDPLDGFGVARVDWVELEELTAVDVEAALRYEPYGSAVEAWQATAAHEGCPAEAAAAVRAALA